MPFVPGDGPKPARIAIVGEAFGASEEQQGKPFVGASGQLLSNVLASTGIRRSEVFITNVVNRRPPGNDIGKFFSNKRQMIVGPELAEGMAGLYVELAEANTNVIVPVGNVAPWALTGLQAISKRRGSILPVRISRRNIEMLDMHGQLSLPLANALPKLHGKKVIPTLHPAHVMRKYEDLVFLKTDLRRILNDSTFPELRIPERTFHIDPPEMETWELVAKLLKGPLLAFPI